ncbi:SETMR methyltransferase, partial [Acromyrmex charruanus]
NEKEQYRSGIHFLFLDGKPCEEIKTKLDAVYGNSSSSMTTVRYHEIAEAVSVSYGIAFNILNDNLGMKNCRPDECRDCSRWTTSRCSYQFQISAKLVELRYELLLHPPYSPDLALYDFFLFPNLKKWLGGKKFTSNEEVIAETEAYFAEFDKSYFSEGLKTWQKRWKSVSF